MVPVYVLLAEPAMAVPSHPALEPILEPVASYIWESPVCKPDHHDPHSAGIG